MAWAPKKADLYYNVPDNRTFDSFKSFCRKCACHHPLDSAIKGILSGCICNPASRRGSCGVYVPTDNLEFLEYMLQVKEEEL